jgi:outer membrane receptor protein involved in Fe transport
VRSSSRHVLAAALLAAGVSLAPGAAASPQPPAEPVPPAAPTPADEASPVTASQPADDEENERRGRRADGDRDRAARRDDEPVAEASVEESLVVTASRIEQEEEDVAAHVTVLTQEEIEGSASFTTDDFLRRVPGFSLFRRSSSLVAHPTTQGVSLRGIGPSGVSRTLVLLDGLPLNDPFGGWVYWGRVPLSRVERIEVVRGGASNVWGNSAMGGVVHLLTRDPAPGEIALGVDAGDRETRQVDVAASEHWEKSAAEIHGDVFETDGYFVVAPEQRGAIDVPAFSEHWNAGGRFDAYPSSSSTVSVRGSAFDEERGNGTRLTGNDTEAATLSVQWAHVATADSEWRASAFGQDQTFASTFSTQALDRSSEVPALDQFDVDSEALGLGLQWVGSVRGNGVDHVLTAGGEARDVSGTNLEDFRLVGGAFGSRREAGGDQRLYGVFVQDIVALGERWQLQLGARGDRWESTDGRRLETTIATGAVTREERPRDREETEWSPRVALLWKPREGAALKASAYQAFRAPTINELFRPFRVRNDITEGNAFLVPEILQGLELGGDFGGPRAQLEVTAFWNEVDDPIANVTVGFGPAAVTPCGFVPAGGVCRQRQNLERTEIHGAEVELRWRPTPRWRFVTSYLMSDAEILDAPTQPELEGNRLAQVPESQGMMEIAWSDPDRFDVGLLGRFVDDQFEDDLSTLELGSSVLVDFALSVPVRRGLDVFVRAENIFDEEVEAGRTADGLLTIGTPFLLHGGFRWSLASSR